MRLIISFIPKHDKVFKRKKNCTPVFLINICVIQQNNSKSNSLIYKNANTEFHGFSQESDHHLT